MNDLIPLKITDGVAICIPDNILQDMDTKETDALLNSIKEKIEHAKMDWIFVRDEARMEIKIIPSARKGHML